MTKESRGPFPDRESEEEVQQPEYVILDDEESAQHEQFDDLARVLAMRVPLRLRLLFALLLFPVFLWIVFAGVASLISGALCVITAMKVDDFRAMFHRMWRQLRRASAFALSLALALLSPSMGLGVLMLYFILHEDANSSMSRMVRSNLSKYN